MEFKLKTPAEFEAMSEYQQEKYLDEKAKVEADQRKAEIKEAAEAIVNEKLKEAKAEAEKEGNEAIERIKAEAQKQVDDLLAQLNRAKQEEVNTRLKGMPEAIMAKLSTEEGEAMIKGFFAGQREKFNFEVDADTLKAPITVPNGSVAPEFIPIVGPGHDDIHARNAIPGVIQSMP